MHLQLLPKGASFPQSLVIVHKHHLTKDQIYQPFFNFLPKYCIMTG